MEPLATSLPPGVDELKTGEEILFKTLSSSLVLSSIGTGRGVLYHDRSSGFQAVTSRGIQVT